MKAKITKQKVSGKSRTALQLLRYLSDTKEKGAGLKCAELIYCNIPEMDPVNQAKALNDMQKLRRNCKSHIYPGIQIISATLMDEWREVANC